MRKAAAKRRFSRVASPEVRLRRALRDAIEAAIDLLDRMDDRADDLEDDELEIFAEDDQ